jgi:hypothetical protein
MKSTAWFQVVILVGVVVAVVLCISPITKGIQGAISNAERVKYFEYHRISYNETMEKIDNIENNEFAVLFVSGNGASTYEQGIDDYEGSSKAVPIYIFNTAVSDENKTDYNADEAWYNYYKVTTQMMTGFRNASLDIYNTWKSSTVDNDKEVSQTSEYPDPASDPASLLNSPTLVWFRKTANIDDSLKTKSTVLNPVDNAEKDYHVAKVYLTIQDSSSEKDNIRTLQGLQKFFHSSIIGA